MTIYDRHLSNANNCSLLSPDNRGKRTPRSLLAIDERDQDMVEASRFFPVLSNREVARRLRSWLLVYRQGAWRRDRVEALCPPRH